MKKRTKFILVIIGLILALTVGVTTTALANDGDGNGPVGTFISKVASILGLDEEQVSDAFKQACQEKKDEALENRLDKAIESGRITEEEAGQILEWWQNQPEAVENIGLLRKMPCIRTRLHDGLMTHRMYRWQPAPQLMGRIFDQQVSGTITTVSEEDSTIMVTTEGDGEVSFQYTSHTRFVLQGATVVEIGQTVHAWCWEDADGDLTAKIVKVELAQE